MNNEAAILVGDVGGTHVRFALARVKDRAVAITDVVKRPGAAFATFEAAVAAYREVHPTALDGAAFGLAGAVREGAVQLLHRNWRIEEKALRAELGLGDVLLVNDFMAMARAAPELAADDVASIAPGSSDLEGALAVAGPGTGLGVAVLRRIGEAGWVVVGGEGGHQAFAPQTAFEWAVAERLRLDAGGDAYISNELVAAGVGFEATLKATAEVLGVRPEPLTPADVESRAAEGEALSLALCRLRAQTVMTALGDLALSANATGGAFVAGGVGVRLARYLREPAALARFYDRGPRTELMSQIPIGLILSEAAPLEGAARLWRDRHARGWV